MSTITTVFDQTATKHPTKTAFHLKNDQNLTWKEYQTQIHTLSSALHELGLLPGEKVSILSETRHEWLLANFAIMFQGAIPTGYYPTSAGPQIAYMNQHCEAVGMFIDNENSLIKVLREQRARDFKFIICFDRPSGAYQANNIYHLQSLLTERSPKLNPTTNPDTIASLIYTSGTTGKPKAVQLTHKNILWNTKTSIKELEVAASDLICAYLPLNHIAEQVLTMYSPLFTQHRIAFSSFATLAADLQTYRPSIFFGVPRVWEKMHEAVETKLAAKNPLFRLFLNLARKYQSQKLFINPIKKSLGLDNCRLPASGAAPISRETLNFFATLDLDILEVYGLSECSGATTVSTGNYRRVGSVGKALPGTEIRLGPDNEILIKGPHVFAGYLNDPEATAKTLRDGWLHSGDLGSIDADGFLRITGRSKNLIITAGGENIAPELIEGHLTAIPCIAQAVVIGDRQKYLGALLTLSTQALGIAQSLGSKARTLADLCSCAVFEAHVRHEVAEINHKLAKVQAVRSFKLLSSPFSLEAGELTPTLKLKRQAIISTYTDEISALYATGTAQKVVKT